MLALVCGCSTDDELSIPKLDGLSLYWDHRVFGEEGRRLMFEFYGTNELEDDYDLVFKYEVVKRSITIRLVKSVDKGLCSFYPMPSLPPDDPHKCNPRGSLVIPESLLPTGRYTLHLVTPFFEETAELTVNNERITLRIPPNDHFSSSISEVYPLPKNLLFGHIVYSGESNIKFAEHLFADFRNHGLQKAQLSNYPYNHLTLDDEGNPVERHWEPDEHSIGFIYGMNRPFKEIVAVAKEHFSNTVLNIYMYSSNGDQALMSQDDGITIVYANE